MKIILTNARRARQHGERANSYQRAYRGIQPGYVKRNKLLQHKRKKTGTALVREGLLSKIVKTDALNDVNIATRGLYEILPYNFGSKKKIVKTDALIVEIRSYQGIQNEVVLKSGSL